MIFVFYNRRYVDYIRMLNMSQGIFSVLVIWLNLFILGEIILVLVYRIDFIGLEVSLKID